MDPLFKKSVSCTAMEMDSLPASFANKREGETKKE